MRVELKPFGVQVITVGYFVNDKISWLRDSIGRCWYGGD